MKRGDSRLVRPGKIRLDASTACQLACPSCPTANGATGQSLGVGFLRFRDFKKIIDDHPWVSAIELANWGEIFLNPELTEMMRYAHTRSVALYASTGANLNRVDPSVLEALVKYRLRSLTCSIDGACQETYSLYRVKGDFRQVIENVKAINRFKAQVRSSYPRLKWQFILFDHNAREIDAARGMAEQLGMAFAVKLSWEDLYTTPFSPVTDSRLIRQRTGLGVVTREEFRDKFGRDYFRENQCAKMWVSPQVNYDGRVLGCCVNFWDDYGNAFQEGLENSLNSEKIDYARQMLLGKKESRADIPCTRCKIYQRMKETGAWMAEEEIRKEPAKSRTLVSLENRMLAHGATSRILDLWSDVKHASAGDDALQQAAPTYTTGLISEFRRRKMPRLESRVHPLSLPLGSDDEKGWKPYPQFKGVARRIRHLSCHVSVLNQDHTPHPPHRHKEEEILMLLSGEVEITLPDQPSSDGTCARRLNPGDFVYYPAYFGHTLTCVGDQAANYLMFKWHDEEKRCNDELPFGHFSVRDFLRDERVRQGFVPRKVFEGPTRCLQRLQCHTSTLTPGAGYPPHRDPYDVAILVLEGEVETLGRRVGPHDLIFYAVGEPHGMVNPGEVTAKYVVFEFQGRPNHFVDGLLVATADAFRKVRDPQRWRGLLDKLG